MDGPGRIYSVFELTSEIREMLENRFDLIWVTGEVSNFSAPASGHMYFTLKDDRARIRCVMFRGQNRVLRFRPENGMEVTGMGRIGVYAPRGEYQVIFEFLEPRGLGALQKAFEQLKDALSSEGLFDEVHKKPLPALPRRIALVTSPSGAAVRDFLSVSLRRFPTLTVDVVPVQVQGRRAADEIAEALFRLDRWQRSDVVVLARGGGSLEDLQPFNSETVARAVFACRIPVVSAVGHETDYTIADFVADVRAPTPSAAAETVVPDRTELLERLADRRRRLTDAFGRRVETLRQRLAQATRQMVHPRRRIDELRLRTDELSARMFRAFDIHHRRSRERLAWIGARLRSAGPGKAVDKGKQRHYVKHDKLLYSIKNILSINRSKLHHVDGRLAALSPLAVLQRGYSITRTVPEGRVLRDPGDVRPGQRLRITLARGDLDATAAAAKKRRPLDEPGGDREDPTDHGHR